MAVGMSKKSMLGREAHLEIKMWEHKILGPLLEVQSKSGAQKVHAAVARSTFRSQNGKSTTCSDNLDVQASFCVSQTCGFCSSFQNDGRHGTFEEDL